jgi:hypothetical protein
MRKHRLAECLLVDVIGLELEHVHAEACRWEHVMSEAVEGKLLGLLNFPTVSPFGNPIPDCTSSSSTVGVVPWAPPIIRRSSPVSAGSTSSPGTVVAPSRCAGSVSTCRPTWT